MDNELLAVAPPETSSIADLHEQYTQVRRQSARLCEPLKIEDYVVQPTEDVSPPKWHLAHTTWFFESFLLTRFQPNYRVYDEQFSYIFNSYYESKGEKMLRLHRGNMTRPSTEEVYRYRDYVDERMHVLIDGLTTTENDELRSLIVLGLHHEQQHQELLLTDIKFILGNNPLFPVYQKQPVALPTDGIPPGEAYVEISADLYSVGYQGNGFHFDNEEGAHQAYLPGFRILNRLVTNAEYLAFMDDGGYENYDLWLAEGWAWINENKVKAPAYWHRIDNEWHHYTLHGLQAVDQHAPVTHVSYFEAEAYARWRGMRLPTEFEWEVACRRSGYAQDFHRLGPANLVESKLYQPTPLQIAGTDLVAAQRGAAQMIGEVWEWTQSAYLPYPYYQRVRGALGEYNGKFMVNQMVLRGGSCATPESHMRITYRNFFQTDKRWQFTGIRLADYL
ncbi:MAG: ergothioneine biosynthesis protein EgtB [Tunicatimonas sp.]